MSTTSAAIVLAAGQGTRMRSQLPKVLHPCAGVPLIGHVVQLARLAGADPIVVVVSPTTHAPVEAALRRLYPDSTLIFAVQAQPRGTGDAVRAAMDALPEGVQTALILYGDVPLMRPQTLEQLRAAKGAHKLALLTAKVPNPAGYGRIVRDAGGAPQRIVEQRDCTPAQAAIAEVNVGVYLSDVELLRRAVGALRADNAQSELYLTDIVATAAQEGTVGSADVADLDEMQGVNSRVELGLVERRLRARLVRAHQEAGVSFVDPKRVYVEAQVQLAQDVTLGPDVQLCGSTRIGSGAVVEGPSILIDTVVQPGARVRAFCHLEGAQVASGAQVGPYARLRPGAELAEDARVGNFVEVKNARLGQGAKANHLAYVGDADVGAGANIGAGTIVANYDGFQKHRTRVGVRAFVGSNSTLIAPLSIGAEAWVAAGSTITGDVPAEALAFGRARQVLREGQAKVLRERLAAAKKAADKPT